MTKSRRGHLMLTDAASIGVAEFKTPIPNRFIANHDPALRQDRFNVPIVQVEIEVEPDRIRNDLSRIPMAFIRVVMM